MGSITVKNVGKAYKQYPRKLSKVIEWVFPFLGKRHTLKWVLNDINFDIKPGEAVGIVGINGAGKSTLLKMITGTSQPTTGSIEMQGRVAALLELGMGFHPEFTGRENAYMSGQLLGITKQEMDRLLPSIEEFAEVGEYIDMPVRVYSSGMQVRLAFSVATAARPDILIVDEALSVGDVYFQHKSFQRIKSFLEKGTTLILVSHDRDAVQSVCGRAILLSEGGIVVDSTPEKIMDYYNVLLSNKKTFSTSELISLDGRQKTISGEKKAEILDAFIKDSDGDKVEKIKIGDIVNLVIVFSPHEKLDHLVVGYLIRNRFGVDMYGTNTNALKYQFNDLNIGDDNVIEFSFKNFLGVGSYSISVALTNGENYLEENYHWIDLAITFEVLNNFESAFIGCVSMPPVISGEIND